MSLYQSLPRVVHTDDSRRVSNLEPISFMATLDRGATVEKWVVHFDDKHVPLLLMRDQMWGQPTDWYQHAQQLETGVAFFRDVGLGYCQRIVFHIDGTGRVSGSLSVNKNAGTYSEWYGDAKFEVRV